MSANTILRLDNRFDDYVIQNGYDNTKFMDVLHISSDPTSYCNRKLFISVKGTEHAPVPLQGVDFKAFRNVKFAGDYIYVIMYEMEPTMGRTWVAKYYNNEKYEWVYFKDKLVWLDISNPYYFYSSDILDFTCYEGMWLYGQAQIRLNIIDKTADIDINCKYESINKQSVSVQSFMFIKVKPLLDLAKIDDINIISPNMTRVDIENLGSITNTYSLGYSGNHVTYNKEKGALEIGRYYTASSNYGSWPTNVSDIFNDKYVYHIKMSNIPCSWTV